MHTFHSCQTTFSGVISRPSAISPVGGYAIVIQVCCGMRLPRAILLTKFAPKAYA